MIRYFQEIRWRSLVLKMKAELLVSRTETHLWSKDYNRGLQTKQHEKNHLKKQRKPKPTRRALVSNLLPSAKTWEFPINVALMCRLSSTWFSSAVKLNNWTESRSVSQMYKRESQNLLQTPDCNRQNNHYTTKLLQIKCLYHFYYFWMDDMMYPNNFNNL